MDNPKENNRHVTDEARKKAADGRKIEKELKIDMVRRLMLRGIKNTKEIQDVLAKNVPPIPLTTRTIHRYKAIIKFKSTEAIRKQEGLNRTLEELAYELKSNFEEVMREAWQTYHRGTTNGSAKISALRLIEQTAKDQTELLQSMGLVAKIPMKHQILGADGNPVDPTINVNKAELNMQFISFIKAKFQSPVGILREEVKTNA